MSDDDNMGDKQGLHEPPDAGKEASAPPNGDESHPFFPSEDDGPTSRDIHFITLCQRRSDGSIDLLFEDFSASEMRSWAEMAEPWGEGEYRLIAKDKNHRIVDCYPEGDTWMRFDEESTPSTLPGQRPRPDPLVDSFPVVPEPPRPPRKRSVIELCSLCHPRMTVCGKAG